MKKSSVFSNKSVTFRDLLSNYSIFVLILLVIFAISFYILTLGPTIDGSRIVLDLASNIKSKDGMFHFSASDIEMVYAIIITFTVFMLQFSFLHKKSSCYTTLSFNINRKKLYRNRLLLPLLFMLAVMLAVKLYVLKLNVDSYGFKPHLLQIFFAHLLAYIKIELFTVFCTVLACLLCGRTIEAMAAGFSIYALPSAISIFVGIINSFSLFGATEYSETIITKIAAALNPLDWSEQYFLWQWNGDTSYNDYNDALYYDRYGTEIFETYAPPYESLIISAVWIFVLCAGLFALGKYFEKVYKPENSGFKGINAVASSFISITLPLFVTLVAAQEFVYDVNYSVSPMPSLFKYYVYGILILVICSLLCNFLIHFTFKKVKYALTGAAATVVFAAALIGINTTDIFNTYNKLPDKNDIAEISLDISYDSFINVNGLTGNVFGDEYDFGSSFLTIKNQRDIELAMELHKSIVDNRDKDTAIHANFCYTLKDGTTRDWEYPSLSEEAVLKVLNLRQSSASEEYLRERLLPDTITDIKGKKLEIHQSQISLIISPIPGSTFYPDLTKVSEEDFRMLREAIYDDVLSLSKDEWFTPADPCLGYIVIRVPVINSYYDYDYYEPFSTPVYKSMKKIINALEKLGFMEYFEKETKIKEVYTADLEAMTKYLVNQDDYYNHYTGYTDYKEDAEQSVFGVIFSSLYTVTIDKKAPVTRVENKAEWDALFKKAYPYYFVGTQKEGKILIVEFESGYQTTRAIYYIP